MRPSSGGGGGGFAAASPQVQETYGDDLSTVNYVDMDFELQHCGGGSDDSGTDTIKPFVKLVNDVSCSPLASADQSSCAHARRLCADLQGGRGEVRISAVQVLPSRSLHRHPRD
eukprot:COSAG04_NODE_1039_length_8605_cov_15.578650_3_plen_114_part_00